MTTLYMDIETYCDLSLSDVGVYKYASHPSFKILLLAYAVDEEPVKIIDLENGEEVPDTLFSLILSTEVRKVAHNAQFERVCISEGLFDLGPGRYLSSENWDCTMIRAMRMGLPASLDAVSKALGFPQDMQKFFTGKSLIKLFCVPRKPSKANDFQTCFIPDDRPEEWQQFKDYCVQDVEVERQIDKTLSKYKDTPEEVALWELDQLINDAGIEIDPVFVRNAIKIDTEFQKRLTKRYLEVTGLDNPKSVAQLKQWLSEKLDMDVPKVTKETLPMLIDSARKKEVPEAIEALKIRQLSSKTSTKKYEKMLDVLMDDRRARGLLQFYGANRTGRWAGRLVQLQNLPQNHIIDLDTARNIVNDGDLDTLEMVYDSVPSILSQLIRTAFVPRKGSSFVVSDFSAIEARVIAWLAGEKWRLDVFASHGKIYEASASKMFGVPMSEIHKGSPLRQKGKVAELALGYGGGVNALRTMDPKWAATATEEELQELVDSWRASNSAITIFWRDCENKAKTAIADRVEVAGQMGLKFIGTPDYLFVALPSKRRLAYREARLEDSKFGSKITYMGMNQTTNTWERQETYGGKLVENIVQAVARDCLAVAMQRVDTCRYTIVMHVHDEIVVETDRDSALEDITNIMSQPISWAKGLPLRADGYTCSYYQKD